MDLNLKKITLSLFLSSALLCAATENVTSIKYDGMIHISESVAKQLNEVKIGEPLDPVRLDKTIKTFFEQGYFEDVWADQEEGTVTFHFKEKPIISKVELKGFKENDEEAQKTLLQIEKGALYDPKRIESAKKRIVEALNQEGKIDSVVEVETEKLENGSMSVKFIANEGEEIIITELKYYGVSGINPDEFDKVVANKEHDFMGWMWGRNDGKLKIAELQYDPLRIHDYYMQFGYLNSKVDEPFVTVDFNKYEAKMSYNVFEGDMFRVSDILVFQDTKVIEDQELLNVISLEKNKPFNIKTFRDDADRIKTKIADLGYAFVQIQPDLRQDKETKTVEVIYRIVPGKKVHIGNVIIAGNNRTLDRVVRRELFLAPGDLYSLSNLKDSRNALGRTGYFETNTIEEKRIDDETMDIVVQAKEAPTGNIQLGGGYGSFGGLLLSAAISDRNIFGSGITVGLNLEKSQRTKSYAFNISNPRLDDSDFSGNFSINNSSTEYTSYTTSSRGLSLGIGHRFSRYWSGYAGYNYAQNSYSNIDANLTGLDPRFYESYAKSSAMVSASYDSTDDYYVAREGMNFSQSFEKAGLGGDADFLKSRSSFGIYRGLQKQMNFDLILRYKARYNYVKETGYLPINERFFMGGIGSVRGYQSYSLSPLTYNADGSVLTNTTTGEAIKNGGKQTFSNSFELSFPLVPDARMRATAFYDYGMIGDAKITEVTRSSYGVSLEWFSPVGPLQLVFAKPLGKKEEDRTAVFEFTIGQRF